MNLKDVFQSLIPGDLPWMAKYECESRKLLQKARNKSISAGLGDGGIIARTDEELDGSYAVNKVILTITDALSIITPIYFLSYSRSEKEYIVAGAVTLLNLSYRAISHYKKRREIVNIGKRIRGLEEGLGA